MYSFIHPPFITCFILFIHFISFFLFHLSTPSYFIFIQLRTTDQQVPFFFTVHSSAFFSFIRSFTDLLSAVFLYLFIHGPFFSYFRFVHSRSICLFVSFHSPFSSCFFRGPPFSSFIHFLSTYQLI